MHHLQLVESVSCFCLPALMGPGGWLLYHPFQALPRMARRLNLRSEHGTGFWVWVCLTIWSVDFLFHTWILQQSEGMLDHQKNNHQTNRPGRPEIWHVWIIYLHEVKNGHIQGGICRQKFPYMEHMIFWMWCDVCLRSTVQIFTHFTLRYFLLLMFCNKQVVFVNALLVSPNDIKDVSTLSKLPNSILVAGNDMWRFW